MLPPIRPRPIIPSCIKNLLQQFLRCVLRDAPLGGAPQDEEQLYVTSKTHLILRSRQSRRLEGRSAGWSEANRVTSAPLPAPARPSSAPPRHRPTDPPP